MIQDAAPLLHQFEMKRASARSELKIDSPDLPRSGLETLAIEQFERDAYELLALEGAKLVDSSFSGLRFDSCVLHRFELNRSRLPNLKLLDVRIEKSSAANGEWPKASLRRVEIIGSRLTGLTIAEGELADVSFNDCRIDYLRLANSKLRNVRFEGCVLTEADFMESNLESVAFIGCDLRKAGLTHAKLTNVDLRGSKIDGLEIKAAQFSELTIDPPQAVTIVQMLGAKIV